MKRALLATVLILAALGSAVPPSPATAAGPKGPADPTAALVASHPDGRKWLAIKESASARAIGVTGRLKLLAPWAERYRVALPEPLGQMRRRPEAPFARRAAGQALEDLAEAIDDAVRRSVAAGAWKPMGDLADWEAFLKAQGFRLSVVRASDYIVGTLKRVYMRPPRLPQAIHTILLTTRKDRGADVFGVTLRYTYPPDVARKIKRLEQTEGNYERALALRLPAFRADGSLLAALGRQALGGGGAADRERWEDFIEYISSPERISSRARALARKNPPTISEVRLFGNLIAHLYEMGPTGRLEIAPKANALDLRGNPLYGARIDGR